MVQVRQDVRPCYYIHESDVLSMLADEEFNVTAIISWNLNSEEKETLYKHLRCFFTEFVISFVKKLIQEHSKENVVLWQIARLNELQYVEVEKLLEKIISDKQAIIADQDLFYNDIWFYLKLAADMKTVNLID